MKTGTKSPLAENVRRRRQAASWTQAHLAEAAEIDERTVQRAEAGEPIAADSLMALAGVFNCTVEELQEPGLKDLSPEELSWLKERYHVVQLQLVERTADFDAADGRMMLRWHTDSLETPEQEEAAAELEQGMQDALDIARELPPLERLHHYRNLIRSVEKLRGLGIVVTMGTYSTSLTIKLPVPNPLGDDGTPKGPIPWSVLVVCLSKASSPRTTALVDKTEPLFS